MNKSNDQKEWAVLHQALCEVCAKHGTEDPFGDGDYWVVDDCWGDVTQKLVVTSPGFLTPGLVRDISKCIASTGLLHAQVVVSLEFDLPGEPLLPTGLFVTACGSLEEWDIEMIRKRVGENFYREPAKVLPLERRT